MSFWSRGGPPAKTLDDLLPPVPAANSERFAFATHDPHPSALLTHGHVDHVMGMGPFADEAKERGAPPIEIVAHENAPARFERYARTAGWHGCINSRQFSMRVRWPTTYPRPDRLVRDRYSLALGDGRTLELFHDRGETDDHLWIWLPRERAITALK